MSFKYRLEKVLKIREEELDNAILAMKQAEEQLRKVSSEIKKYSPKSLDLFLNHDPRESNSEWGYSVTSNVPQDFGKTFYPLMLDYSNFSQLYDKLRNRFKKNE